MAEIKAEIRVSKIGEVIRRRRIREKRERKNSNDQYRRLRKSAATAKNFEIPRSFAEAPTAAAAALRTNTQRREYSRLATIKIVIRCTACSSRTNREEKQIGRKTERRSQ